jgi:hypothetical protein
VSSIGSVADETWLGEGDVTPHRSRYNPRPYLSGDGRVVPFQSSTFRLGTR